MWHLFAAFHGCSDESRTDRRGQAKRAIHAAENRVNKERKARETKLGCLRRCGEIADRSAFRFPGFRSGSTRRCASRAHPFFLFFFCPCCLLPQATTVFLSCFSALSLRATRARRTQTTTIASLLAAAKTCATISTMGESQSCEQRRQ